MIGPIPVTLDLQCGDRKGFIACINLLSCKATYPSSFFLHGEHDNGSTLALPYHPPEIISGVGQGTLGRNEGVTLVVALKQQ